jgi:hypothetical protein
LRQRQRWQQGQQIQQQQQRLQQWQGAPTTINYKLKKQWKKWRQRWLWRWWRQCGGSGNSNSDSGGGNGNINDGVGGIGRKGNSVVICHTTAAMCGKHNNKPKEGRTAKMPGTKASNRQQPAGAVKGQEGGATQMPVQQHHQG